MSLEKLLKDFRKEMEELEKSISLLDAKPEGDFLFDFGKGRYEIGHYLEAVTKSKPVKDEWVVVKMVK